MEFYAEIVAGRLNGLSLCQQLTIHNLPRLCASIHTILADNLSSGVIYCLWGEFTINREDIKHGVRFSLPSCPNALAWTVTIDQNIITVHCTINKKTHDMDFISSIHGFMADWVTGIKKLST